MFKKNKKAALELSIGTIVVLVIAVTMLVLGMILVRTIMCSGIIMVDDITSGAREQISDLFGSTKYGVRCLGEGSSEAKLGTGARRKLPCMIRTDDNVKYELTVKEIESLSGAPKSTIEKWILDQNWEGSVSSNDEETPSVLYLDIPRDAPQTTIKIKIIAKNMDSETETTHISYVDIVPMTGFKGAIC